MHLVPVRLVLHTLAIPLRRRFRHGAAERAVAEPLVLEVHLANGAVGYGEAHPRPYVTGERLERLAVTIQNVFVPVLANFAPTGFFDAMERVLVLPWRDADGQPIAAARAAVELALLDAYCRAWGKSFETVAGWMGDAGLLASGRRGPAAGADGRRPAEASDRPTGEWPGYSGVLSADLPSAVRRQVFKMRLIGLRDFKLKVGDADDDARVRAAVAALRRPLDRGRCTLRLDANGAWTADEAADRLQRWRDLPIACVEQPLAGPARRLADMPDASWDELAAFTQAAMLDLNAHSPLPLMADESLVTPEDAERLATARPAIWFNIRIAKNGGLLAALRIASQSRSAGVPFQLGCLVGETSILSAAGHWFLRMAGGARFAEGAYGRHLSCGDVCARPIQLGWRGRIRPLTGPGLGVRVEPELLRQFASAPAATFGLA